MRSIYLILFLVSISSFSCKESIAKSKREQSSNNVTEKPVLKLKPDSKEKEVNNIIQESASKQDKYRLHSSREESHLEITIFKFENNYRIVFKNNNDKVLYSNNFKSNKKISDIIFNCYSLNFEGDEDGGNIYILRSEIDDGYFKSWKELDYKIVELKEEEPCQEDGP